MEYQKKKKIHTQKFQKVDNKIIQRRLQIRMIKKQLKKDIYHQKNNKQLLIILILI